MSEALRVDDRLVALDPEGYLKNLSDWSPEVAQALAAEEGLILTPEHWEVIEVLREFYRRYQLSPTMRPLVKAVAEFLGSNQTPTDYF